MLDDVNSTDGKEGVWLLQWKESTLLSGLKPCCCPWSGRQSVACVEVI